MDWKPIKTAVLIPAFNSAATIGRVVSGALAYSDTVLVVDDGSADATAAQAATAGAQVLRHQTNQGKGAALRDGMRLLAEQQFERVVTMDADGQHLADQIPVLLQASDADVEALVVGVRQVDPTLVTPLRGFGNRFANRWVEIACGQALPDTQSGFRLYPLRATLALGTRARRFAFETEVLIRATRAAMTIRSVPVKTFYPPVSERVSHYRPVVDTLRIICVVVGLILRLW